MLFGTKKTIIIAPAPKAIEKIQTSIPLYPCDPKTEKCA